MKSLRSGAPGLPCSQRPRTLSASTVATPARLVLVRAEAPASALKPLRFYSFDPSDPENVVEVVAKAAEPVRKISPPTAPVSTSSYYNGNGNSTGLMTVSSSKEIAQVQALSTQLELARTNLMKLQQYEVLYKESRMRAKQAAAEMGHLQTLVAEKDAELSRQYKRMEVEASERSQLRTLYTSASEEVKNLRVELDEHRQAMVEMRVALPSRRGAVNLASSNGMAFSSV